MGKRELLFCFISLAIALFIVIPGIIEYIRHCHRRNRVRLRIHVNGTRGKSSVTRLIAAGLRAGGHVVIAKATGTTPRIIYPEGKEEEVFRLEKPNIIEQLFVFKESARLNADAVVVECMALLPQLQKVCEEKIIKSHIGVITNARNDHLDVMGPTIKEVASSLLTKALIQKRYIIWVIFRQRKSSVRFIPSQEVRMLYSV
jgi:poly-gamma-glutamate synthase PgsB/CapB